MNTSIELYNLYHKILYKDRLSAFCGLCNIKTVVTILSSTSQLAVLMVVKFISLKKLDKDL